MQRRYLFILVFASLCTAPAWGRAQDNVTIPKSRLDELERKERELERLKGEGQKPAESNAPAKLSPEQPAASKTSASSAAPINVPSGPPMDTLPPFQDGQTVEATDLSSHYQTDRAAAAHRYDKHRLTVRGEIVAFEKPLLRRNYRVQLRTPERQARVICDLYPPERFNAVFTTDHGTELVGLIGETRVPLAKTGDMVSVQGVCRGWHDGVVMISASEMHRVP